MWYLDLTPIMENLTDIEKVILLYDVSSINQSIFVYEMHVKT